MDTKEFLEISDDLIQNQENLTEEILENLCNILTETITPNEIGTRIIQMIYREHKEELYPEISDCFFMAKENNQGREIQLPFLFKGQRYLFIIHQDTDGVITIHFAKNNNPKFNQILY